jgi:predicted peptidase
MGLYEPVFMVNRHLARVADDYHIFVDELLGYRVILPKESNVTISTYSPLVIVLHIIGKCGKGFKRWLLFVTPSVNWTLPSGSVATLISQNELAI